MVFLCLGGGSQSCNPFFSQHTSWSRKILVVLGHVDHHLVHHRPQRDRRQRQVERDEGQNDQHSEPDAAPLFLVQGFGFAPIRARDASGCGPLWEGLAVRFQQRFPVGGFVGGVHAAGTLLELGRDNDRDTLLYDSISEWVSDLERASGNPEIGNDAAVN